MMVHFINERQAFRTSREATADYLDEVADWFENNRWMRGKFANRTLTQACAMGAMRIVAGARTQSEAEGYVSFDPGNRGVNVTQFHDGREAFERCLLAAGEIGRSDSIFSWNDQAGTNKRKVIRALRKCAKALRAQETRAQEANDE